MYLSLCILYFVHIVIKWNLCAYCMCIEYATAVSYGNGDGISDLLVAQNPFMNLHLIYFYV